MPDRLQRFRDYMERLDAAADPRHAIERNFYVSRSSRKGRSLVEEMAGRLELHPASTHLVVGGIGSGKTTQLLVAEQRLARVSDTVAIYIDVSLHQDIGKLQSHVLLILAGMYLIKHHRPVAPPALMRDLRRLKEGYDYFKPDPDDNPFDDEEPDAADYEDDGPGVPGTIVTVPGIVTPPERTYIPRLSEPALVLKKIRDGLPAEKRHVILLFDSMDRVVDPSGFEEVVAEDLGAFRALNIGVIMVGPPKLQYGTYRHIVGRFDQMHPVTWPDPAAEEGRGFLLAVLRARAGDDILSDEAALRLVELSGGVLRDLVGMARSAGEEAYLSGDEVITATHAEAAGEAFGRTLLFGLDADELAKLQVVRTQQKFVWTSDKDIALLMTGRVIEYRGKATRYAVHPTIEPLLVHLSAEEPA